ncbi:MAG: TetR/AcrR family transcriptional regulator [Deltaproteobacteria bacterium]|nr:TetR/AcrR family transcriptional regulator [Deltaproteobacteria bacterium]
MVQAAKGHAKRGQSAEQTRQAIIDTAVRHFARHGYRSTSVGAIAQDVGISTAAVFWHFDTKEGLLQAILDDSIRQLLAMVSDKELVLSSPTDILGVLSDEDLDIISKQGDLFRMMLGLVLEADDASEKTTNLLRTLVQNYKELLASHFVRTGKDGNLDAARIRATLMISTITGALLLEILDGEHTDVKAILRLSQKLIV